MLYREAGQYKTTYARDMAIFPIAQDRIGVYLLLAFAFIGVPLLAFFKVGWFGNDYMFKAILIPFLIMSLAAIGLNILTGYCGQISLGAGAFMAIGAYAAYNFALRIPGLPIPAAILLGGGVSALAGILFGIPSLRIKGLYLAVATLAAQFFFDWLFLRVKWFTNYSSSGSVNAPQLDIFGGFIANSAIERYLMALTFVTFGALLAKNLVRGNIGRQWMAIRDMDIAAELMGIRPLFAKLSAFAVSSFFVGTAGALWAFVHLGSWEPLAFSINISNQLLFMIIIGGLGSILGSFLGAAFLLLLPVWLDLMLPSIAGLLKYAPFGVGWIKFVEHLQSVEFVTHLNFIITGSLICYLLIVEPHGFARLWAIAKEKLRMWPFPY
jgi:branched-chain amino acid transport system permease protein